MYLPGTTLLEAIRDSQSERRKLIDEMIATTCTVATYNIIVNHHHNIIIYHIIDIIVDTEQFYNQFELNEAVACSK